MRAELEGWQRITPDASADRRKRIDAQYDRLIAELERLTLSSEDGAGLRFNRARADAVMAMVKALEKIGETMRTDEDARDNQITDDAELAAVLQRIDDRIRSLARQYAGELGAAPSECA